jgi:hypothetical protein
MTRVTGAQSLPEPYLKGIEVGVATGWGKMKPEKPDSVYGFTSRDYMVVGWQEPIESAAFGDVDGDEDPHQNQDPLRMHTRQACPSWRTPPGRSRVVEGDVGGGGDTIEARGSLWGFG